MTILIVSLFSFFRTAPASEPKLKKISYRGGVVEFSIPANWKEEYERDGGGMFYEQSWRWITQLSAIEAG